jgi:hypothetical protein
VYNGSESNKHGTTDIQHMKLALKPLSISLFCQECVSHEDPEILKRQCTMGVRSMCIAPMISSGIKITAGNGPILNPKPKP